MPLQTSRWRIRSAGCKGEQPRSPDLTVSLRLTLPAGSCSRGGRLGLDAVVSGLDAVVPVRSELLAHLPHPL